MNHFPIKPNLKLAIFISTAGEGIPKLVKLENAKLRNIENYKNIAVQCRQILYKLVFRARKHLPLFEKTYNARLIVINTKFANLARRYFSNFLQTFRFY